MERIYLDHAATTPVCKEALDAMLPWLEEDFGNPSSLYREGRMAREAIDKAREEVSRLMECAFGEVVFTSSGTEAANLAILGAALAARDGQRRRILFGASEHHAVLHTQPILEALGYAIEQVRVNRCAVPDLNDLADRLGEDVLLVSAMHANNELGTLQPVERISAMARSFGALCFCDAIQTAFARPWTVDTLGADLLCVSAHKFGGPKGAGALYVRAGTRLKPWTVGGGQEREMRAGTENVAGIVGLAAAAAKSASYREPGRSLQAHARDAFLGVLVSEGSAIRTVTKGTSVLDGHAHVRFPGLSAESMLIALDRAGVSASSGAACSSGSLEPSHVLMASGYSEREAKEGVRFTFGVDARESEALEAAGRVLAVADQVAGGRP